MYLNIENIFLPPIDLFTYRKYGLHLMRVLFYIKIFRWFSLSTRGIWKLISVDNKNQFFIFSEMVIATFFLTLMILKLVETCEMPISF